MLVTLQSKGFPPLPIPQNLSTWSKNKNEYGTQIHSYNRKKTSKPSKKPHTAKPNPAFTEQQAGNHPHICHCRQEIWMSQEKPTCQIHRPHPVSP